LRLLERAVAMAALGTLVEVIQITPDPEAEMGVAVRPVPFVAGMRIWRWVAAPPGSAASNQSTVVKFMLGCVVVNRLGRKSWKKVHDQEVMDRHDLFSPCQASLVRRSPGMCWSMMGRKDFMVGPN
jgi:hypothetical protein